MTRSAPTKCARSKRHESHVRQTGRVVRTPAGSGPLMSSSSGTGRVHCAQLAVSSQLAEISDHLILHARTAHEDHAESALNRHPLHHAGGCVLVFRCIHPGFPRSGPPPYGIISARNGLYSRVPPRFEERSMHSRPVSIAVVLALVFSNAAYAALPDSLPSVTSGALPGPAVLYAPAPAAPQLENRDPRFVAPPLLVSGTEAYANGEYLYQDYLYDDYGSDTDGAGATPLSARAGDIDYPTNTARYGNNAADIVEFRIKVSPTEVAYRITLNTLLEADSTIVVIAF